MEGGAVTLLTGTCRALAPIAFGLLNYPLMALVLLHRDGQSRCSIGGKAMSLESTSNDLGQPVGLPVTDWQPRLAPPTTPIQGRFCSLVTTDVEAHGPALYAAFAQDSDHGNWTYLPYGPFHQEADFIAWLSQVSAGADPMFHSVLDTTGMPVGLATYLRIEPNTGVIEVGHIHFSPLMQRTPVATEAMYLMMRRVFDELGYRRYEWKCNSLNAPSCAAARRLGFTFEGIFRQATIVKGCNRDTTWFSMLDSEWPQVKASMEAWLSAENFDTQGAQVRNLQQCRNTLLA